MMIAIVDYGMGNVGSVSNMLRKLGAEVLITSNATELAKADKLILPGVGAFDTGMKNLDASGLRPILDERVHGQKTPILGICLGMQLLSLNSEEGGLPGLGWIPAETVRFALPIEHAHLRVPHMGWNSLDIRQPHALLAGYEETPRFYFAHSYHVRCTYRDDVIATCDYGICFDAVVARGHIMGAQFHPEKSHAFGLRLLENFLEMR